MDKNVSISIAWVTWFILDIIVQGPNLIHFSCTAELPPAGSNLNHLYKVEYLGKNLNLWIKFKPAVGRSKSSFGPWAFLVDLTYFIIRTRQMMSNATYSDPPEIGPIHLSSKLQERGNASVSKHSRNKVKLCSLFSL